MKKMIAIILTLFMMVAMVACQSTPKSSVDGIKKAGKLVMATSADYPPFENIGDDGSTVVGFDVDISKAIADKLGVELEVKNMDFKGLLEALSQGKADIVAAGMSANEERKKSVDFSQVYFVDKFMLVVQEGNEGIKTAADMGGKKIGAQLGSTCQTAAEGISGVEMKTMDKVDQLMLEVKSGRLDGAVVNLTAATEYLESMGGLKMTDIPELNVDPEGYAIAIKKGNTELTKVIDEVVDELKSSGEYDKLLEKWGLSGK